MEKHGDNVILQTNFLESLQAENFSENEVRGL